jgi:DNA-binding CsgD family transcriptional regulator
VSWLTEQAQALLDDYLTGQASRLWTGALDELAAFRLAADVTRRTKDPRRGVLAIATAYLSVLNLDHSRALGLLGEVVAEPERDTEKLARAHIALFNLHHHLGRPHEARHHAKLAAEVADATASPVVRFQAGSALILASIEDDPAAAAALARRQVAEVRTRGDLRLLPAALNRLSWALLLSGEIAGAQTAAAEMLELRGGHIALAELGVAGRIALAAGDARTAAERFQAGLQRPTHPRLAVLNLVEGLALAYAHGDHPDRALRLLTAVAIHRQQLEASTDPWSKQHIVRALAALQRQLPKPAAAAARRQGARLSLEQLLTNAVVTDYPEPAPLAALSRQEATIAGLIARGLTTRQIAARLGISTGTVVTYIARARTKLGISTRTGLAAWAARNQPAASVRSTPGDAAQPGCAADGRPDSLT